MAAPLISIQSGAIQGCVWPGNFGPMPTIKKAKRSKDGKYVKDENGKQEYSDFYNFNDLKDVAIVAQELYGWKIFNPDVGKDADDQPAF